MNERLILKSQANEIFELIDQNKLNPSDFHWAQTKSIITSGIFVSILTYNASEYYFKFDFAQGKHYCEYSPGKDALVRVDFPGSWDLQIQEFTRWLSYLKREIEAPNLWDTIFQERKLAEAATISTDDNKPFTSDERSHLTVQLHEIKEYLFTTQTLSSEHQEFVEKRLDYLEEAMKRQGRKDWLHTTIAVLFTIVMGIRLDSNSARELFRFVTNALHILINGILALP